MQNTNRFIELLQASGPAAEQAGAMNLFGQFIGSWEGRARSRSYHVDEDGEVLFDDDSAFRVSSLEVHFGWVLQGRVIQDVWIAPALKDTPDPGATRMYGSTLRVYDVHRQRWFNTFIDPVSTQSYHRMQVYEQGKDIVQEYRTRSGKLCQWVFTEITGHSFHWLWRRERDGNDWDVPAEFFLNRVE